MSQWSKQIPITLGDTDQGGVVYFANTFKLTHKLIEFFIVDRGIPWEMWFNHPEWLVPIKQASCNYMRPLLAGRESLGKVAVKDVGQSSLTFETRIFQDDQLCAVAKTTHVFVDRQKKIKMNIPGQIRSQLCRD